MSEYFNKKDLIINSALELFSANGYQKTKIIDIANNAGVGKGTIYEYFKDKKSLFDDVLSSRIAIHHNAIENLIDDNLNPLENLSSIIKNEIIIVEKDISLFKIFTQIISHPLDYEGFKINETLQDFQTKRFNYINKIIKEGVEKGYFRKVNSEIVSLSILSSLNSFIIFKCNLHSEIEPLTTNIDFNIEDLFDYLLNGVLI